MPVVSTTAAVANVRPSLSRSPVARPFASRSSTSPSITVRLAQDRIACLHGRGIELAVRLGARAAHRRALAAVEHAELDAARVRHAAHEAVKRVDLADEMAFAEPADRGIARHGADGREPVGDQRRARAHPRGGGRGLAAGMAATDDNHIEAGVHRIFLQQGFVLAKAESAVKTDRYEHRVCGTMFHVKHGVPQGRC